MEHLEKYLDHTLLKPAASREDILEVCKEALSYGVASVCVNSCHAALVHDALEGSGIRTCCVVGFPLGAMSTSAKAFEAATAVSDGASEIDMVINIGWIKSGDWEAVEKDIRAVVKASAPAIVKVISGNFS